MTVVQNILSIFMMAVYIHWNWRSNCLCHKCSPVHWWCSVRIQRIRMILFPVSGLCKANPSCTFLTLWAMQTGCMVRLPWLLAPYTTLLERSDPWRQSKGAVICVLNWKISEWLFPEIKISTEKQGLIMLLPSSCGCLGFSLRNSICSLHLEWS